MINYSILKSFEQDYTAAIQEIVSLMDLTNIVRIVFFITAIDNEDYTTKKNICKKILAARCPQVVSLTSVIAQRPLVCNVVAEVQSMDGDSWLISQKSNHVVAENESIKYLFSSDLVGDINTPVYQQSQVAFEHLMQILNEEGFELNNIVRQWNYIEKILYCDAGHQNYQDFNDVRSHYYDAVEWSNGYPAATGIGMQQGGVILEFDAVQIKDPSFAIKAIDNTLQRAAHVYSKQVLLGEQTIKSTPKFERAKAISSPDNLVVYISGTAAIRGEASVDRGDIVNQTRVTMENIEHLISSATLTEFGVETATCGKALRALRVYIKNEADTPAAKEYMDLHYPTTPTFYLWGNVCREELLIEIEGFFS